MAFELRYHPEVRSVDIPLLDGRLKTRIKTAIETRLATAPHQYGEPLRKTLHGYWKLRVGDYRLVYKILGDTVLILAITNRKKVYEAVGRRLPTSEKGTDTKRRRRASRRGDPDPPGARGPGLLPGLTPGARPGT